MPDNTLQKGLDTVIKAAIDDYVKEQETVSTCDIVGVLEIIKTDYLLNLLRIEQTKPVLPTTYIGLLKQHQVGYSVHNNGLHIRAACGSEQFDIWPTKNHWRSSTGIKGVGIRELHEALEQAHGS